MFDLKDHYYDISLVNWSTTHHPVQLLVGNLTTKRRSSDQTTVEKTPSTQTTQYHGACLHAASFRHVVCILTTRHYVLQSVSVLDIIYVILMNARVARLSTARAHMAYLADAALVGRRVSFLVDLIFHALYRAGISSTKEPAVLSRSDGKRPNGQTLTLGKLGKMSSGM